MYTALVGTLVACLVGSASPGAEKTGWTAWPMAQGSARECVVVRSEAAAVEARTPALLALSATRASQILNVTLQHDDVVVQPRSGKCSRAKRAVIGAGLGAGAGVIVAANMEQEGTGYVTTKEFMRVSVPVLAVVGAVAGALSCPR